MGSTEEVMFVDLLEVRMAVVMGVEEVVMVVGTGIVCSVEVVIVTRLVGVMLGITSADMAMVFVVVLCSIKVLSSLR